MIRQSPTRYKVVPLLSPAEERVLCAILSGYTTGDKLAQCLHIETRTVRTHLVTIRSKTYSGNMADIVLWAWRNGYDLPEAHQDMTDG